MSDAAHLDRLDRVDRLSEQLAWLQAWNRELEARLEEHACGIRANTAGIADTAQCLGDVAIDPLDRTTPQLTAA